MNEDYLELAEIDRERVDAVIAEARSTGKPASLQSGAVEYAAHPEGDLFAWSIDGGWFQFNPKRGVRHEGAEMGLNDEYFTLDAIDKARVDAVIADARRARKRTSTAYGRRDYYAYPHPGGGYAWGIDDPYNIKRGIER